MSNATVVQSFDSALSMTVQGLATNIHAWLQTIGSVMLLDATTSIQENARGGRTLTATLTATNAVNGGQSLGCAALIGFPALSVDGQFSIWIANNPTFKIVKMLDVTPAGEDSLNESLVIIYSTGLEPTQRTILVENSLGGSVPHLSSATMTVWRPSGSPTQVRVTNVSGIAWGTGVQGYASWDVSSGTWTGVIL